MLLRKLRLNLDLSSEGQMIRRRSHPTPRGSGFGRLRRFVVRRTTAKGRDPSSDRGAARMFVAIEKYASLEKLRQLVEDERHSFGWGYLVGSHGGTAESAFSTFAKLVESAKK